MLDKIDKIRKNIPKRKLRSESIMHRSQTRKKSKSNISGIQQVQQAPFLRIRKKLDSSELSEGVIFEAVFSYLVRNESQCSPIVRVSIFFAYKE